MTRFQLSPLRGKLHVKHGFPFLGEHFSTEGKFVILTPGNFIEAGGFKFDPAKAKYYLGEFPESYLCEKGDLIVAMTEQAEGLLGCAAIVPEDNKFLHNQRIGLITVDKDSMDRMFTYYLFNSKVVRTQLRLSSSGSKVKHTSPDRIYDVVAPIPLKSEQERISKVLSSLDAKITINNRINAELEAMAKLVYDYWFVQFDFPMSKEQAARIGRPELEGRPYRNSGGPMVYNAEVKREVPEGWGVKTLADLADIIGGSTPSKAKSEYFTENGTPWITPKDLSMNAGNRFITRGETDVSALGLKETSLRVMPKSTVMLSTRAPIGYMAISRDRVTTNQGFKSFVPNRGYSTEFVFLTVELYLPAIKAKGSGSTFMEVSTASLRSLPILLPDKQLVEQFTVLARPFFDQQNGLELQNQELATLRDWLLPMLMNGQVKVGAAEYKLEEKMAMAAEAKGEYGGGKVIKMVPQLGEPEEQAFVKRKMLASYIINRSADDPHFGHTKFEKLLHLTDYHVLQRNLNQRYIKKAAGPYDNSFTIPFFEQTFKAQWFAEEKHGDLQRIIPGPKNGSSRKTYDYYTEEELRGIDALIGLFSKTSYEAAEIVSTLYAVWNNRIILDQPITDKLLKEDFLAWDEQKARYAHRLDGGLTWMRQHDVVPNGWGRVIERAKGRK